MPNLPIREFIDTILGSRPLMILTVLVFFLISVSFAGTVYAILLASPVEPNPSCTPSRLTAVVRWILWTRG